MKREAVLDKIRMMAGRGKEPIPADEPLVQHLHWGEGVGSFILDVEDTFDVNIPFHKAQPFDKVNASDLTDLVVEDMNRQ